MPNAAPDPGPICGQQDTHGPQYGRCRRPPGHNGACDVQTDWAAATPEQRAAWGAPDAPAGGVAGLLGRCAAKLDAVGGYAMRAGRADVVNGCDADAAQLRALAAAVGAVATAGPHDRGPSGAGAEMVARWAEGEARDEEACAARWLAGTDPGRHEAARVLGEKAAAFCAVAVLLRALVPERAP